MSEHVLPAAEPRARPNGWWGAALFVATEATLFGALIATYATLRFHATRWPQAGVPEPRVVVPLLLTALLVSSSVPMAMATRGGLRAARGGLLCALAIQASYFGLQTHVFLGDLDRFTPQGSAYGSIWFTLAGAHLAHVAVGLLADVWLLARLVGGMTRYRAVGVSAAAFYWHAVNALAIVVVLVQVSPSL